MKIEKTTYGPGWEAYLCENNGVEMIVVAGMGPHIMSFKLKDGPNILFEDKADEFKMGPWHIYGGSRFWVGPENRQAYAIDNDPCKATVEPSLLKIAQKPDSEGLVRVMEISPCPETEGFIVRHVLRHEGPFLYTGAIWILTCVVPTRIVAPWAAGSRSWQSNRLHFWRTWAGHGTNVASPQWKLNNDYFAIEPTGEEGKVGLYSEEGFIAALRPDGTFIKTYQPVLGATYPDAGCNVELYTHAKFMEMETLSPVYVFYPGQVYSHTERWVLTGKTFKPEEWEKMKALLPKDISRFS
jgi:hypothetical protein